MPTDPTTAKQPENENVKGSARIKINKLLEAAGWRFFSADKSPANIQLEPSGTLKTQDLDALGENFEKATKGSDYILLRKKIHCYCP